VYYAQAANGPGHIQGTWGRNLARDNENQRDAVPQVIPPPVAKRLQGLGQFVSNRRTKREPSATYAAVDVARVTIWLTTRVILPGRWRTLADSGQQVNGLLAEAVGVSLCLRDEEARRLSSRGIHAG